MNPDEFHGQGGTYEVKDGKRVLVTPPTQPHPEGDRARDADGNPVDLAGTFSTQKSAPQEGFDAEAARATTRSGSDISNDY